MSLLFQLTDEDIGYEPANPLPELSPRMTTRCILLNPAFADPMVIMAQRIMNPEKPTFLDHSLICGGIDCLHRGEEVGHDRDVFETEEAAIMRETLEESGYGIRAFLPGAEARSVEIRTRHELLGTNNGYGQAQHCVAKVAFTSGFVQPPQLTAREIERQQTIRMYPYDEAIELLRHSAENSESYSARFVGARDATFMALLRDDVFHFYANAGEKR